jgi:hypothetical protein
VQTAGFVGTVCMTIRQPIGQAAWRRRRGDGAVLHFEPIGRAAGLLIAIRALPDL